MADVVIPPSAQSGESSIPWYKELNSYHWWVFFLCVLGWTFDTMDQRLFILARNQALTDLYPKGTDADTLTTAGRYATMWFVYGWATGGILFGILGDKLGRAKTMMITILVYAIFTALSGLTRNAIEFNACRFLTGLGVGGEFAAGVALMAEVIPERPRPLAIGLMQGLSAVGNITGSMFGLLQSWMGFSWRWLFAIGAIPALLVVLIRKTLKEPESWIEAKRQAGESDKKRMGSFKDLLSHPRWRKNALLGVGIAVVGVTGLWGISFYSPELVNRVQTQEFEEHPELVTRAIQGEVTPDTIKATQKKIIQKRSSLMMIFQDIGAFFSMYGFAFLSARIGRKNAFHICCLIGLFSVWLVFGYFASSSQIWWMGFLLGFGTLSLFGGYAVYFPELFPTRLRSTGVSFCYNVGRYLAGFIQGPFPKMIKGQFDKKYPTGLTSYRATSIAMSFIYIIGMVIIFFAPETKGKPLPTDEDEESLRA
ncbi:MFS transporter [Candidatus Sumerlaeota bacterium]|nr:MFS transporter [Candidatus Sumerlaeota bacterium]